MKPPQRIRSTKKGSNPLPTCPYRIQERKDPFQKHEGLDLQFWDRSNTWKKR